MSAPLTATLPIRSVRDLLRNRWGVPLTPRVSRNVLVPLFPFGSILRQDAARIGFVIVNEGDNVCQLSPFTDPFTGTGIRLDPSGGALITDWEQDGEQVAWEWFGNSIGNPTSLYIVEVLLDQGRQV